MINTTNMDNICSLCGKKARYHFIIGTSLSCDQYGAVKFTASSKFKAGDRVKYIGKHPVNGWTGTVLKIEGDDVYWEADSNYYTYKADEFAHKSSSGNLELLDVELAVPVNERPCKNKWCQAKNYLDAKICWKCETKNPTSV